MKRILCCLSLQLILIFTCTEHRPVDGALIEKLIAASVQGITLREVRGISTVSVSAHQLAEAKAYILAHPDFTSYHLLFFVKRYSPLSYHSVPDLQKAQILVSTLTHQYAFNDWGHLAPKGSHDREVAQALLALGDQVVPILEPVLDDDTPVGLFGSEEATISLLYQYRRCDYAYRYICVLLGKPAHFAKKIEERDRAIQELKKTLASNREADGKR
jgi:hypothetical protein